MSILKLCERRHNWNELQFQEEIVGGFCRSSERVASPSNPMEQEKRIRREIANSNERRRMQSINAGFQSLRTLLPHHEGEKLSKAAILQQTAEYIYQLEQEKTSLLSQNCQLKRLVNQHEGQQEATAAAAAASIKRRKLEPPASVVVPLITSAVSTESPDEGIGSMSPEPVAIVVNPVMPTDEHSHEMIELRVQLDRERRLRLKLEEQMRNFEAHVYPERLREMTQQLQYQYRQERRSSDVMIVPDSVPQMQVVTSIPIPSVTQTALVAAASPPIITRSPSPSPPSPIPSPPPACPTPPPPPPPPPQPSEQRLPSALEAAIKAEPKVEVERLPSPGPEDSSPQARLYLANTSRQNLETIVEAIRHLEGDHLFSDEPNPRLHAPVITQPPTQDAPLALTTQSRQTQFLAFRQSTVAALQQQRPGVIVVKQNT